MPVCHHRYLNRTKIVLQSLFLQIALVLYQAVHMMTMQPTKIDLTCRLYHNNYI